MNRDPALTTLLEATPHLWRGRETRCHQRTLASGNQRLDKRLPGGGWPIGAVTELITSRPGLGELSLLFPALAAISASGQWLILVDPPWIPYPAALHGHGILLERLLLVRTGSVSESLWSCEQALHSCRGGAVLAWPEQVNFARLRRLQLAAAAGGKLAFLFRPPTALGTPSPAALRLHLQADEQGTRVDLLKCRGERPDEPLWISRARSTDALQRGPQERHPGTRMPAAASGQPVLLPAPFTLN